MLWLLSFEVGKGGMRQRSTIQNVRWCYHVTQSQHGQSFVHHDSYAAAGVLYQRRNGGHAHTVTDVQHG
jgi:hypothetical protein